MAPSAEAVNRSEKAEGVLWFRISVLRNLLENCAREAGVVDPTLDGVTIDGTGASTAVNPLIREGANLKALGGTGFRVAKDAIQDGDKSGVIVLWGGEIETIRYETGVSDDLVTRGTDALNKAVFRDGVRGQGIIPILAPNKDRLNVLVAGLTVAGGNKIREDWLAGIGSEEDDNSLPPERE